MGNASSSQQTFTDASYIKWSDEIIGLRNAKRVLAEIASRRLRPRSSLKVIAALSPSTDSAILFGPRGNGKKLLIHEFASKLCLQVEKFQPAQSLQEDARQLSAFFARGLERDFKSQNRKESIVIACAKSVSTVSPVIFPEFPVFANCPNPTYNERISIIGRIITKHGLTSKFSLQALGQLATDTETYSAGEIEDLMFLAATESRNETGQAASLRADLFENIPPAPAGLAAHAGDRDILQAVVDSFMLQRLEGLPLVSVSQAAQTQQQQQTRGAAHDSRVPQLQRLCQKIVALCEDDQVCALLELFSGLDDFVVEAFIERVSLSVTDLGVANPKHLEAIHLLRLCGPAPAFDGEEDNNAPLTSGRVVTMGVACQEYELALENEWRRITSILETHLVRTENVVTVWVLAVSMDLALVQQKCLDEICQRGLTFVTEQSDMLDPILFERLVDAYQQCIMAMPPISFTEQEHVREAVFEIDEDDLMWQDEDQQEDDDDDECDYDDYDDGVDLVKEMYRHGRDAVTV